MQKFWLKNFDLFISASLEEAGLRLVQQGAVRELREIERNFWVASVADQDQKFETEILLTPNKIKAYACECREDKRRRTMCAHIVASLLTIRRYLDRQRQPEPDLPPGEDSGRRRISLRDAIQSAPENRLREFVLEYAQSDRKLAYQLRIQFADQIPGLASPLEAVVDQAFPAKKDRPINRQDVEALRQSLNWLRQKMQTAIGEQHCAEAWQILGASAYALQKANVQGGEFRELAQLYYSEILALWLSLPPALLSPELLAEAEQTLTDHGLAGMFPPAREIPVLVWVLSLPARQSQRYADWFSEGVHPSPFFLLGLLAGDLALRGRDEAALKVLRANEPNAAEAMRCLELFVALQTPNSALRTADAYADILLAPELEPLRSDLKRMVVAHAAHADAELLQRWLIRSGDADYLPALRRAYGKKAWAKRAGALIEQLRKAGREEALAMALIAENRFGELTDLLAARQDITPILDMLSVAEPDYENRLCNAVILQLSAYLETHFGDPASLYAVNLIEKLYRAGLEDCAGRIAGALLRRFPDRANIQTELRERKIPAIYLPA